MWRRLKIELVVGIVLLAAALAKSQMLPVSDTRGAERVGVLVETVFEGLLAAWLLSGYRSRIARRVTIVTFAVFAVVAGVRVLQGRASCGCFGLVEVDPAIVLVMDVLFVGLLLRPPPIPEAADRARVAGRLFLGLALAITCALALPFVAESFSLVRQIPTDRVRIVRKTDIALDEPFGLAHDIEIDRRLDSGRWLVVLYSHGCADCLERAADYRTIVARSTASVRFAFVEVPPYSRTKRFVTPQSTSVHLGRLSDDQKWFISLPLGVLVSDGTVEAVFARTDRLPSSL